MKTSCIQLFLLLLFLSFGSLSSQEKKQDVKSSEEKYKKAAKGVHLPPESQMDAYAAKGGSYKEIVEWIKNKDNWAEAFKKIDEKLGLFCEDTDIKISFSKDTRGYEMVSQGFRAKGYTKVNIDAVARVVSAAKRGQAPGCSLAGLFTHELVHTYQGFTEPLWLVEGWAEYVGGDTNMLLAMFVYKSTPIDYVNKASGNMAYARGPIFFHYLREKHGEDKLKSFVNLCVNKKTHYKEALEKTLKMSWEKLLEEEKEYASKWLEDFKASLKDKRKK